MIQSGDHGEVLAVLLDQFEIRRGRIAKARFLGEEEGRVQAEVVENADEAHRRFRVRREGGPHRLEPGERQGHPGAPQKVAARKLALRGEGEALFHESSLPKDGTEVVARKLKAVNPASRKCSGGLPLCRLPMLSRNFSA